MTFGIIVVHGSQRRNRVVRHAENIETSHGARCGGVHICKLPEELLMRIFRWVGALDSRTMILYLGGVCKQWQAVLRHPACRVRLSFRFGVRRRSGGLMQTRHLNDMSVLVTEYNALHDSALVMMLRRFGGVEGLMLFGCNQLTDAGLRAVADTCPNLEWLCLASCGRKITDVGLNTVASACSRIRFLDVTKLSEISFEGLAIVCDKCPHLRLLAAVGATPGQRGALRTLLPTRVHLLTQHRQTLTLRQTYLESIKE
eukprot:m.470441 g.470441  ORF g.470441 m.470441 type:complete len:257 (-) comp29784_c0_seq1:92-862(-)